MEVTGEEEGVWRGGKVFVINRGNRYEKRAAIGHEDVISNNIREDL